VLRKNAAYVGYSKQKLVVYNKKNGASSIDREDCGGGGCRRFKSTGSQIREETLCSCMWGLTKLNSQDA
jgi:uncharacterized ferredoxin-like protein